MDQPTDQDYLDGASILPNPRGIASTNAEENPDVAAQSVALSKQTGIPAPVIHADPDRFAEQLKAQTAGDIVAGNPQLQRYVASDPMAAKVSSDDWDKLDEASQATSKLAQPSIFQAMGRGWSEGWDIEGQKQALDEIVNAYDSPAWRTFATHVLGLGRAAFDIPAHAISGVVQSGVAGLTQAFANAGDTDLYHSIFGEMASGAPERLGRDLNVLAQTLMMEGHGLGAAKEAQADVALDQKYTAPPLTIHPHIQAFLDLADKIKPFVQDGKDVPIGVHAITDQVKADEAKTGADALKEATKAAQASATRERSPEMFRDFISQHTGEDTIGVSADAVLKLYGGKIPEAGEGPLGFVPDLPTQLQRAAITGADIKVPKADWLTYIDPKVADDLLPDVRVREGGITQEEAKNLPKYEEEEEEPVQPVQQPIPAVRVNGKTYTARGPELRHSEAMEDALKENSEGDVNKALAGDGLGHTYNGKFYTDWEVFEGKHLQDEQLLASDPVQQTVDTLRQVSGLGPQSPIDIAFRNLISVIQDTAENSEERAQATIAYLDLLDEAKGERSAVSTILGDFIARFNGDTTTATPVGAETPTSGLKVTREGKIEREASVQPKALDIPGGKAKETPAQTIKPSTIGINADQAARYQKLIAAQQAADTEAALRRAEAFERRQQTPEWKSNEKEMRGQVTTEITQQPRFIADQAIRNGDIGKLDVDSLTDEQRASLPSSYYKRGGESPDWVARVLGYSSGDDLITDLAALKSARGDMKPGDYLKSLIDSETARRMEDKYGKLEENIIETAKEQVLTETQLDLLHADLEQLSGGKLNFTKEQLRQNAAEAIGNTKLSAISSDSYLASAGRAGRAAEDALLKGDPSEAFRQRQRQYTSTMYAKEAMKVEKAKAQFDKLTKRFSKREVAGALQEYTNQIHDLMVRLGLGVKRSVQDIAESTARDNYSSFGDFVNQKESSFRELHVPDFLKDASFHTKVNDLTSSDFMQVAKAFKALAFNARDEAKIIRAGEKADLTETTNEMIEKLESLGPAKTYRIDRPPSSVAKMLKSFGWSGIQMETMFNRFDRDDPLGVFNQTIVRTYTEAANYKDRLVKQFQDKLNEIGRIPDINKLVRNDLFIDPITNTKFAMSKRNVLGVLANIGNESNLRKLAAGYKLSPEAIKAWVEANTTKEDWDRAQKIGNHFNELFDMANTMSHNISGVGIEKLPLQPIQSKFGTYKGWYNPVSYDPIRPGQSQKLLGPNALEQDGYYRATTPQGYTKGRTGYIAPIELNLDIIPKRMQQMIHDIAMRPAIIQLSKFFYNPAFKRAVINHYGSHQAEMMVPFLRDIANVANFQSQSEGIFNKFLNQASQNMVGTMIGMNPSTVMKHGPTALVNSLSQVGLIPWAKEFGNLLKPGNDWGMAMEKSDELNRRMRNWQEVIANTGQELGIHDSGAKSLFKDVRSVAQYMGTFPISASDLLSAVPTWLASYKKSIADGVDEGQARFLADRDVRQAHGSSIITNKPAIARSSNAMAGTISRLYGFFSHILQKQYEIAWRTKDAFGLGKEGDIAGAVKSVPKIAGMIVSYVLAPALIEELVTPYTNSDRDSWGAKAAKTLGVGISSSLIGFRDFAYAIINNRDPQGGILGGEMKAFTDPIHDLATGKAFTVAKAGDFLKHMATMVGVGTGITNAQEGKSAEFIYNYFHNREHPQNLFQTLEGLRYGKTKGHSKSFDDWLQHEVPK